jgi:hypothetical protein
MEKSNLTTTLIYYGRVDGLRIYGNTITKRLEIHLEGDIFGDIFSEWKQRNKKTLKKLKEDLKCFKGEM